MNENCRGCLCVSCLHQDTEKDTPCCNTHADYEVEDNVIVLCDNYEGDGAYEKR